MRPIEIILAALIAITLFLAARTAWKGFNNEYGYSLSIGG